MLRYIKIVWYYTLFRYFGYKISKMYHEDSNGWVRPVVDYEIDGVDFRDYPDFCDTYFASAVWYDTLEDLTDDELDTLTDDNLNLLNELAYESCH